MADEFDALRKALAKPAPPPPTPIPDRWKYDPTRRNSTWERYGMWCLVGVVAVVMLVAMAARRDTHHHSAARSPDSTPRLAEAYLAAKDLVTRQLKAPTTAEFSRYDPAQITDTGTSLRVRGYVDSQNSFGAMLRSQWVCDVTPTGQQEWYGTCTID